MFKAKVKVFNLALMISLMLSGCAVADITKSQENPWAHIDWSKLSPEERAKLEAEIKADQERLQAERQAMLEMSLMHEIGDKDLQFKSVLAKLYGERKYQPLWANKIAEKQFLRDYAAMVASGISSRSAKSLEAISEAEQADGLTYDVLVTDAFLDYLYYTMNVNKQAQNWLYAQNSYQPKAPSEEQITQWLNSVQENKRVEFVASLSTDNRLYRQTIQALPEMISASGLGVSGHILAINAQRLRVIPDFNNGIFVNIPSYKLNYFRDDKLILESRVIVGKDARRTPVMYSKLSNVVINPPWNAPIRLINEDIVPKLRQDPSYAAAHNYSILDKNGNAIDPYSIDWSKIGKNFPYRIRQAAGDSALGNYKFNMPSSDAIYLHDTPNHSLFNKKNRALSSGCVRVEKSDQLAAILLKEAGWTDEKRGNVLASKKTTSVSIRSDNPVFLYYVTAWVEDGKVQTLPDIYGYDKTMGTNQINWAVVKKYL